MRWCLPHYECTICHLDTTYFHLRYLVAYYRLHLKWKRLPYLLRSWVVELDKLTLVKPYSIVYGNDYFLQFYCFLTFPKWIAYTTSNLCREWSWLWRLLPNRICYSWLSATVHVSSSSKCSSKHDKPHLDLCNLAEHIWIKLDRWR